MPPRVANSVRGLVESLPPCPPSYEGTEESGPAGVCVLGSRTLPRCSSALRSNLPASPASSSCSLVVLKSAEGAISFLSSRRRLRGSWRGLGASVERPAPSVGRDHNYTIRKNGNWRLGSFCYCIVLCSGLREIDDIDID